MNLILRKSQPADLPFLKEILYEAVFWRANDNKPLFEEGLAFPDVAKALADWGKRAGDTAVIATLSGTPVGAAWYRYWTEDNYIRGYMDDNVPVLVIGVHRDHRHKGIGTTMIEWLLAHAKKNGILKMSLMVSKDNYALKLYEQQGFENHSETEDSFTMVRKI
ncbi:MAG: GNAT family N-acetyltransferase [Anaerolineae bacterium]|jgi:ribosomal protein S18 acetylase RimI-like enzyme|nr:GNAT family N-acetyltransferase [Anaerolineae bacterium]MBT7324303.1 GNAT family N-acetyltransferase [Anaerolineae bacterium]